MQRNLDWIDSHNLLDDGLTADRYRSWRLAELAGRFFPDATGDDLDLGADAMGFFFLFDDHFDGPAGNDVASAAAICDNLIDLSHQAGPGRVKPHSRLAAAWADVWWRSTDGMSPVWRARAAHHWRVYFASYVTEAQHRQDGRALDVPGYLELRRRSIATDPVLDLAERTGHFETSAHAFDSSFLRAVRRITSDVVILVNDVCSVEKEEARGDPHNLILVMRRREGRTHAETVAHLVDMVRTEVRAFVELSNQLAARVDDFGLSTTDLSSVDRYVAAARACMRGNYDWGRRSDRYSWTAGYEDVTVAPAPIPAPWRHVPQQRGVERHDTGPLTAPAPDRTTGGLVEPAQATLPG